MAVDLTWVGSAVSAVGNVYTVAKTGQITADTLNKESEMQDKQFAYSMAISQQATQNTIRIVMIVAVAAIVGLAVLMTFKKKVT